MVKKFFQTALFASIFSTISFSSATQTVKEPRTTPEWEKPYQPFRVAGNLYYVGTHDLACYLITGTKGNILINTGLASSESQIKSNIESLGFKYADIKILLTSQVHYDHVGAIDVIKKRTGAQLMVDESDASVMADGGNSDYELGKYGTSFAPVKADRLLKNGDTIRLGELQLVMLHHPGHTKGSCSFLFTVKDEKRSYRVLIANMPTIVTSKRLSDLTAYPTIAGDYAFTLRAMKNISFDIWLAAHASQFQLHLKRQPGDGYNPEAFIDQKGFDAELADLQKQYDNKLKQDLQNK